MNYIYLLLLMWCASSTTRKFTTLPYAISQSAAAYDQQQTIWIIGGNGTDSQLSKSVISFDIYTQIFSVNTSGLQHDLSFQSQGWTHHDNILYMIGHDSTYFDVFNVETRTFTFKWNDIQAPNYPGGCLVYFNNYLMKTTNEEIAIYSIDSDQWLNDVPSMSVSRNYHSCGYDERSKYVYQIGGFNGNALNSVEKLYVGDIDDINLFQSRLLSSTLWSPRAHTRSVVYLNAIYVMGGWNWNDATLYSWPTSIDIIDTYNDIISSAVNSITGTSDVAIQKSNTHVYLFGGYAYYQYLDSYQYQILETIPTYSPTNSPTHAPTNSPTNSPTSPTDSPTNSPTNAPTSTSANGYTMYYIYGSVGVFVCLSCIIIRIIRSFCKRLQKNNRPENDKKKYSFEALKNVLAKGVKSGWNYCAQINDAIDEALNERKQFIATKNNIPYIYNISNYVSSICVEYKEIASLFTGYCIVHNLMNGIANLCSITPCQCNNTYRIVAASTIIAFLVGQCVLYYYNHKKTILNQEYCCVNGEKYIINSCLFLIFMVSRTCEAFSCHLMTANQIYVANIIALGTIVAYIRFKKQFIEEASRNDIDECILQIKQLEKEEQEKLRRATPTRVTKYEFSQSVSFVLQVMAIRYKFEVSIVIVYVSVLCVFQILYNQCVACMDNSGELVLRATVFVLFLLLTVMVQTKVNRSSFKWAIFMFIITICLMHNVQPRTLQCVFELIHLKHKHWIIYVCSLVSWIIIGGVLCFELRRILKRKKFIQHYDSNPEHNVNFPYDSVNDDFKSDRLKKQNDDKKGKKTKKKKKKKQENSEYSRLNSSLINDKL